MHPHIEQASVWAALGWGIGLGEQLPSAGEMRAWVLSEDPDGESPEALSPVLMYLGPLCTMTSSGHCASRILAGLFSCRNLKRKISVVNYNPHSYRWLWN